MACESELWLPAGSVTVALTVHAPAVKPFGVMFHVPSLCTRVDRVRVSAGVMRAIVIVTVCPGATSVLPVSVGGMWLVTMLGPPSISTAGGSVSTVSCWEKVPVFPAPSTTEAVTV